MSIIFSYLKFNFLKLIKFDKGEISINLSFSDSLWFFSKFNSSSFISFSNPLILFTFVPSKFNSFKFIKLDNAETSVNSLISDKLSFSIFINPLSWLRSFNFIFGISNTFKLTR